MTFRITDRKGDDYYNDSQTFATREAAEAELEAARQWCAEQAKVEPTWEHADLIIAECEKPTPEIASTFGMTGDEYCRSLVAQS